MTSLSLMAACIVGLFLFIGKWAFHKTIFCVGLAIFAVDEGVFTLIRKLKFFTDTSFMNLAFNGFHSLTFMIVGFGIGFFCPDNLVSLGIDSVKALHAMYICCCIVSGFLIVVMLTGASSFKIAVLVCGLLSLVQV